MISSILTLLVVGLVAVMVVGVVLNVIGAFLGLAAFLLFKVAPVLLVGWLVMRFLRPKSRAPQISEDDRKWLES